MSFGFALGLLCVCFGFALALLLVCFVFAFGLLVFALDLLWICFVFAMSWHNNHNSSKQKTTKACVAKPPVSPQMVYFLMEFTSLASNALTLLCEQIRVVRLMLGSCIVP